MKTKKDFIKKLAVNKVTVANLKGYEMNHAKGGAEENRGISPGNTEYCGNKSYAQATKPTVV
ncbi:MAG: hypothetical protein GY757_40435 [bacterium]|nr:hypothetical protein [bacterium]